MKTLITSIVFFLLLQISVFAQNRICGWDTEKISSIEVRFTSPDIEKDTNVFNAKSDMDAIISFLKKVEFRELNSSNLDSLDQDNDSGYKISFQGQRDQVYLLNHSASIGKTSFIIDQNVIKDFTGLIQELVEN